jgi:hypothetical protein
LKIHSGNYVHADEGVMHSQVMCLLYLKSIALYVDIYEFTGTEFQRRTSVGFQIIYWLLNRYIDSLEVGSLKYNKHTKFITQVKSKK